MFNVIVPFSGFSGKLGEYSLGWSSFALIKTEQKNILFDTGGPAIRNQLSSMLEKNSLLYDDIDIVILSHLHFDHTYNIDKFPKAEFVFSDAEWEYANDLSHYDPFIDNKIFLLLRCFKTQLLKEDNFELLSGLKLIFTPGHTPGCISLVIDQGKEKWILAGDAVKNRGELRTGNVQMTLDTQKTTESLKIIRSTGSRILPGHDGWLRIHNNEVFAEGGNDVEFVFGEGVTVNNGKTSVKLSMD